MRWEGSTEDFRCKCRAPSLHPSSAAGCGWSSFSLGLGRWGLASGIVIWFQLREAVSARDVFHDGAVQPAQPQILFPLQFYLTSGDFMGDLRVKRESYWHQEEPKSRADCLWGSQVLAPLLTWTSCSSSLLCLQKADSGIQSPLVRVHYTELITNNRKQPNSQQASSPFTRQRGRGLAQTCPNVVRLLVM